MRKKLRLPSPAMTVACIALAVALSGASYAAVTLPRNSVGTKQLKRGAVSAAKIKGNAVNGAKIADGSVGTADVADASLQAGDLAPGTLPSPGPEAFARVADNGTLQPDVAGFPPQNRGTLLVAKGEGGAATGTYCFDLAFRPASAIVSLDNADTDATARNLVTSVAIDRGEDLGDCPASHNDARVRIVDGNTEAATNARFFVWFMK